MSLSNSNWWDYSWTVDAIKKQLQSANKVSLALDSCISTNKLAITLVITYYMDRNWVLREVHLALDEVDHLFFSFRLSSVFIIGQGQQTGAELAVHFKDFFDRSELTDGCVLGITPDNASSNLIMACELQATFEAYGIEWPALRNHIPCTVHIIQLPFGLFRKKLGVIGHTKSWDAHEHDQQFGVNERIQIGKSQRLRKEGNTQFNQVSVMRQGVAKTIEKVRITIYFETAESDHHIPEND